MIPIEGRLPEVEKIQSNFMIISGDYHGQKKYEVILKQLQLITSITALWLG
jgi:hypothetical protein